MKKQFLFIAFACASSLLKAQSVPNGGFENWTNQVLYEDPQYWTGMNILMAIGAPQSAIKSTDAHSGTYALRLKSILQDIDGDGQADTIPGMLMLGTIDLASGESVSGYPFTQRPDSLIGWYKLTSGTNSSFFINFSSSKWDAGSGMSETVGSAHFEGPVSSQYIRFSVPIDYSGNAAPDSIQLYISNSNDDSGITNELFLDDLSFVYNNTAGITENTTQVQLYPNPVTNQLKIRSDQPIVRISVKDIHGKQVFDQSGNMPVYQVETTGFTSGIYFCELYFSNGASERVKFLKQ